MRLSIQARKWRRSMPHAWKKIKLFQLDKISGCVTISVLNALWPGHGILRASPMPLRLAVVFGGSYLLTTVAELMWLIHKGPQFTGFESPTKSLTAQPDSSDALVEELGELPPADLREEALELAKAMLSFEAGTDREFVNSLAIAIPAATEAEKDEVLDKQSAVLMEHNLSTWRAYRDQFYRPARALRDEMRKRLGIRNVNSEPRIPALDEAVLSGAKPITQAANYLAGLARRLR